MLEHLDIANVLFLDIETVSQQAAFTQLDDNFKSLWQLKSKQLLRKYEEGVTQQEAETLYPERAAIYAEFGKIVCISVGFIAREKESKALKLRLKSFANEDESALLQDFSQLISQYYNTPSKHFLCGHNIREFDIPYICRRMVINQLPLPRMLDISGKKPWELKHLLDTMELWKFGDYKSYTSLNLLAAVLGFPTPKDDIDGSQVGKVFWEEKDLSRIAKYCEKDVLAVVQLLLRYMRQPLLNEDQVISV